VFAPPPKTLPEVQVALLVKTTRLYKEDIERLLVVVQALIKHLLIDEGEKK
jgi:hypothetical protein